LQDIEIKYPNPLDRLQYLYTILFRRALDSKALQSLGGKPTENTIQTILASEEYQNKRVQVENIVTLYQELFGNPPPLEKKQEYMAGLILGQTYVELREELIQSSEFKQKPESQPQDRELKLRSIYKSLLGREITDIEKQQYTGQQATEQIVKQILESKEYKERTLIEQEITRMINSKRLRRA